LALLSLNGATDYVRMDKQQTKIVELLREVHLIAIKEIERLNSSVGNPEIMNEHQVADYIGMSVASVRRWRTIRNGPKFLKIGSAVRYKREEVEGWLNSCPGLR
jgi:predicted DNA-binding transcriptional regulator AlpA